LSGVVGRGVATSGSYLTEAYFKRNVDRHCAFLFQKIRRSLRRCSVRKWQDSAKHETTTAKRTSSSHGTVTFTQSTALAPRPFSLIQSVYLATKTTGAFGVSGCFPILFGGQASLPARLVLKLFLYALRARLASTTIIDTTILSPQFWLVEALGCIIRWSIKSALIDATPPFLLSITSAFILFASRHLDYSVQTPYIWLLFT